ncbi:acyl carrier protein [Kitasatospora sp. NPDC048365]|uniref:acyl carrier protein n=1 Tax=Kitasatospora sp. NPDC048365 TaxID=3364050 RepID=UPI003710AEFD
MTTDALPAGRAPLGRTEVLAMLARYGDRAPEQVDEVVGSLELTWLIAEAEQHYDLRLDLDDEQFARIRTVDDAVAVLREVLGSEAAAP